ncbi:MAG: hypothetical protein QOF77_827 [Solirubrobacteraceae bacterium]|nr:hypothetical protein [Solirubrobacteraceae bacterium]
MADTHLINELTDRVALSPGALPRLSALGQLLAPHRPIHFQPVITPLVRAGVIFGHVITPPLEPAPTAPQAALRDGTLWFDPRLLGSAFAATSGWVGVPFAAARLTTAGNVHFAGGSIVLDPAGALGFSLTSPPHLPVPDPGEPIGRDYLDAGLTPFPGAVIEFAPTGATIVLDGGGAATMFGQTVGFTPRVNAHAAPAHLPGPCVALACHADLAAFAVGSAASSELALSGAAEVTGGAVSFPIFDAAPAALPQPVDAWGLVVDTGPGLRARFGTLSAPAPMATAALALLPTRLAGQLRTSPARLVDRYRLWHDASPPPAPNPSRPRLALPAASVTIEIPGDSEVGFVFSPGEEAVIVLGRVDAVLDRPVAADGTRIPLAGPGVLGRVRSAAGTRVEISARPDSSARRIALVAENALIPVANPGALVIIGRLQSGRIAGAADILFATRGLVPTLPDPYAARYALPGSERDARGLVVSVKWGDVGGPSVAFAMVDLAGLPRIAAGQDGVEGQAALDAGLALVTRAERPGDAGDPARAFRGGATFALLDLSTRADLWGVVAVNRTAGGLGFDGLRLTGPGATTPVFTVPGISWEPVVDRDTAPPEWLAAFSPDDGTPTTFLVATDQPTPLIPTVALERYRAAAGSKPTQAHFTLPFGITARLVDGPNRVGATGAPVYRIPRIAFPDGLRAARALSIRATGPKGGATLPGTARVGYDKLSPPDSDYGAHVLGIDPQPHVPPTAGQDAPNPAGFFDQQFDGDAGYIPVERIDLGGYGTSMFSDWHDGDRNAVGVVRAGFDVLLGRTGHELVQFQTWILPWSIRLQRTVVFDRGDGGEVLKHDSGWVAVGDGAFELLDGATRLDGPVNRLRQVRNIVFAGAPVHVPATGTRPAETYARVTFDADVAFASGLHIAADGKDPAPTAAGHGIVGYASNTVGPAPAGPDVIALMERIGVQLGSTRLSGATACVARVGAAGAERFTLNVSSFGAALAPGPQPRVQVALFGTPRLPKDGQWSIARRAGSAKAPQAVDPRTPVPLTRGTGGAKPAPGGGSYAENWRLLDPEDAQSVDAPATFYGLLQGTGTSKTLLEHPLIRDDGGALGFDNRPQLADVGALLGVGGLFPELSSALEIPSTQDLPMHGDGFKRTYDWDINDGDRTLLDLAVVHLLLVYSAADPADPSTVVPAHGSLKLEAAPGAPNWSLRLSNLSFEARVDGFGTLLTIAGDFLAGAGIKPGFVGLGATPENPQPLSVQYGDALSAIKDIFAGLSELASSLGGDADLEVGFTGQQLTVKQGFTLPTIPLGFGEITDLGIELGFVATIPSDVAFHVGIGGREDPFHWLVDPLAGTGAIVIGVAHGAPDLYIEAGLGLGLGISVAVASGSASIVVSMSLAVGADTVRVGLMLTGNAEVDVLGGVASASLTLSAGIQVTIHEAAKTADLTGTVAVSIHISICWVISVGFDGAWDFTETISL